jgi:hypothetical protein
LTAQDYDGVLEPMLDEARREGRRLRILCELGPDFEGLTAGAAWEDARLGLRAWRLFSGCAIVTDIEWVREATRLSAFLVPCPVRVFSNAERAQAIDWLAELPKTPGLPHRLIENRGVIVVEVDRPLRAHDFEGLGMTADSWIEGHGSLQGLVVHARSFPGWENLGGLVRHVQFVRDHHKKVRRVAIAADGAFATLAPQIGQHFVSAEVRAFPHDALGAAIDWAAESATRPDTSARDSLRA